jgi:hypothetical protein
MSLKLHIPESNDWKTNTNNNTKYPRGRIFEIKDKGFAVCVGNWIKDYPQVKQLVKNEFQLPENTEFIVDQH